MSKNKTLSVTQNSEGTSPLVQRLQRRILASGGVINKRQLHRHYQSIQETTGRLNQRLGLPERVQSGYRTSIFQPGAILQRLQRRRREFAQFPQLQAQPILSQFPVSSSQSDSGKSRGNQVEEISTVSSDFKVQRAELFPQPMRSPKPLVTERATPLRINRQATISAGSTQFLSPSSPTQSYPLQRKIKPVSNSETASSAQAKMSNPSASASSISAPFGQLRVSKQATMAGEQAQFTPITVTEAHSSVQGKGELSSEPAQELTLVQTPSLPQPGKNTEKNTVPTQTVNPAQSSTSVSPVQPQVQFKSQPDLPKLKAAISTQAKDGGSLPRVKAQRVDSGLVQAQTMPATPETPKHPVTKPSMPVVKTQSLTSGLVQAQRMPTTAEEIKPSQSQRMPSNIIWRNSSGESLISQSVAGHTSKEMARTALPLVINKTNDNSTIARQIAPFAGSMVELPDLKTPTIPASIAEMGMPSVPEINVQQIAEQVSRILARQLTVERERRGMSKWH